MRMSNLNLGLGHIGIIVKDLEVSKKFYCDNLNFAVTHENTLGDNDSVTKIAFVEAGGCTLELIQIPGDSKRIDGQVDHIAFKVTDIENAWMQLKAKGIIFETENITTAPAFFEKGDRWILFRGPDGERLEINEIL